MLSASASPQGASLPWVGPHHPPVAGAQSWLPMEHAGLVGQGSLSVNRRHCGLLRVNGRNFYLARVDHVLAIGRGVLYFRAYSRGSQNLVNSGHGAKSR